MGRLSDDPPPFFWVQYPMPLDERGLLIDVIEWFVQLHYTEQYDWGCKDGVHVGWAIVEADTRFDVLATVPEVMRPQTRIVQLNRFTRDEVMAFHEGELSALAEPVGFPQR